MKAQWEHFKDWWLGKKCPKHGTRPITVFHSRFCGECDIEEYAKSRRKDEAGKRERRIEEIAEAIRRAGAK